MNLQTQTCNFFSSSNLFSSSLSDFFLYPIYFIARTRLVCVSDSISIPTITKCLEYRIWTHENERKFIRIEMSWQKRLLLLDVKCHVLAKPELEFERKIFVCILRFFESILRASPKLECVKSLRIETRIFRCCPIFLFYWISEDYQLLWPYGLVFKN